MDVPYADIKASRKVARVSRKSRGNYIATLVDDTVADPSSSDDAGGGATATGTTSTAPSSSDSDSKRCRHLYPRDPPAR
ncbi:hypothetical protein HZH66_014912 [Vespula vulgaris]|uniref:Uncharacterized protein n=1 Tax=Vespula vulgaris TaxID=7454 RepID=A0A834J1F5_VESVU|nr:hypothetical protein HZH66_014912 [Vespula vulgaris]